MRRRLCLLALLPCLGFARPILRAQQPALSPDGKTLVFTWQGDLWSVPSSGGMASRITVHPAMDQMPKWSPDGSKIVFASNRYGSYNLFSIKPDGTDLKRISYDSGYQYPNAFSPDGQFVYGYTNAWGGQDVFRVKIGGGDLVRLTSHPLERKFHCSISPNGSTMALCLAGGAGNWRKPGIKGTSTSDIWLADNTVPLSKFRNVSSNDSNDSFPTYAQDGTITFVSNRSGWPNLWRMNGDGSGARLLTQHRDGTVRYPTLDAKGQTVVYEFESALWVLDTRTGQDHPLTIEVGEDQRVNPDVELTMTSGVTDFSLSPNGKRAVLAIRGDLFLIPERGGTTKRLTFSPALDGQPVWLDAKTILFVTARNGKKELMTVDVDGNEKPFLSDSLDLTSPSISPDGKMVAAHRGMNEIVLIPPTGGSARPFLRGTFTDALTQSFSYSWSPDSKWLVADLPTDRGSNVVVKSIDGGPETIIAQLSHGASSTPRFLPNGRGVYFTAAEYGNPDLFVVDLVPADLTFAEDDLDKIDSPKAARSSAGKVEIYEPGILDRMRRLTTQGASGPLASPDSRQIWANVQNQISGIPVSGGPATPIAGITGTAAGLELSADNQRLDYIAGGKLFSLLLAQGVVSPVGFSAVAKVNYKDEERALFDEIWWAMDRLYYDSGHNGKDWARIKEKYSAIVPFAYDRDDFYALMGEMMEELDSSHLGATAPATPPPADSDLTGWLGVDFDPAALAARNSYIVSEVFSGTPAAHPQSLLMKGDRILEVDGAKLGSGKPLSALLNRKGGHKVELKIDRGGRELEVTIKPIDSIVRSAVNYDNWVRWEREQVDKLSNGQLAYMHIRAMDDASFDLFLRQIRTLTQGKKGVVFDVRYNGGGSTAQKILGVLIKTPWLIRTNRGAPGQKLSENIYRGDSLEEPSVLLINGSSFSNAEIFAEGFRKLKIGPVVGERTAGGVIGTGAYGLWDGGMIRMPASGAYTVDGENLEANGRKPDINILFDPNAWSQGRDVMLEGAVKVLMKQISK